jgi:hypothetical protein
MRNIIQYSRKNVGGVYLILNQTFLVEPKQIVAALNSTRQRSNYRDQDDDKLYLR